MITIVSGRHAANALRGLRLATGRQRTGMSQAELARRVYVTPKAVNLRERGRRKLLVDVVIETARVFGYDVALVPARHPGARPTGTGWPA